MVARVVAFIGGEVPWIWRYGIGHRRLERLTTQIVNYTPGNKSV